MFNIAISPVYWWPVTVSIPANGVWEDDKFEVQFRRYSRDEITEILRVNSESEDRAGRLADRDTALLLDAVKGWRDLFSGSDPVEFSQSALESLLKITPARVAILRALLDSQARAREKN